MFELNARIKIGRYTFNGVNQVEINKSIYVAIDNARITMPSTCAVKGGSGTSQSVDGLRRTGTLFNEGDKVSIDLGYNGDLRNEFRGFVRRVNLDTPLVIDLEGYGWQLRRKMINKAWKGNVTLREVLEYVIDGTDIVLSDQIPVIPLTDFKTGSKTALEFLDFLRYRMKLTVYFNDNVLYAGMQMLMLNPLKNKDYVNTVKYKLGYNTINNKDLKQRLASDTPLLVQVRTKLKTGKFVLYETGTPGGDIIKETIPYCQDQANLKNLAADLYNSKSYNGYQGKINGFLQPYCQPAWKANIKDGRKFNGEQINSLADGDYFVSGTKVTYGVNGARRTVSISYRLDSPALKSSTSTEVK